jgi:hypothetical protein
MKMADQSEALREREKQLELREREVRVKEEKARLPHGLNPQRKESALTKKYKIPGIEIPGWVILVVAAVIIYLILSYQPAGQEPLWQQYLVSPQDVWILWFVGLIILFMIILISLDNPGFWRALTGPVVKV